MRVHTPKPHRGWTPEGTATWQRAEKARQALLAYMHDRNAGECMACKGQSWIAVPTPRGVRLKDGTPIRVWSLPVVCPHCRPEDYAR